MADEIIKTVENVDRLFPEIVVNGESHVSENYVPTVQLEQVVPQAVEEEEEPQNTAPAQTVQGQDVYAVDLNNVLHDFSDRDLTQDLANEVTARQTADGNLQTAINGVSNSVTALQGAVSTIQVKIPNQASSENQLADKNFVNSSIATNTANFLGTYTSLADIEAIPNPTNNDYAYLDTTDSSGNTVYKRYKYNAEDDEWLFEYDLNNSSFTAEQWATINSGLTQQSVDEDIAEAIAEAEVNIDVYQTKADAEADLPNLDVGDFVATEQGGDGITDAVTDGDLRAVTSNAVYDAIKGLIKYKDIQINFSDLTWTNYSQGGYYGGIDISRYLTGYTTLLGITTTYWTGIDCRGFCLCFDSNLTRITVIAETQQNSAYVKARIVYI